ncbi:hypothetical protein ADK35_08045 [Streptomyces viridochromogenes]|uniref:hypothetical protein n=1 Tax=Streptomyces viridochromogenes TaxID=1938 RepID=UPI00069ECCF4|nr:hypothetical protein [Streptomyces viridochromogenes]KOG25966.1 hypothetical protein ADK35_08045 [Streptomyces viridochromogenes]
MTATFAAVFVALYVGHTVGDHWVQTHHQACIKGGPGWAGRLACGRHVLGLTLTKGVILAPVVLVLGLNVGLLGLVLGLGIDAVSHYWADRRTTLARLAEVIGKGEYYRFGAPRPGHDDNPHIGTGAYSLDQSWHVFWLLVAALLIAAV